MESIQVTIFSWGTSEGTTTITTNNQDGKNQLEIGRNTVVEATYSWHPKTVLLAQNICMLDGDRAIMIRNKVSRITLLNSNQIISNLYDFTCIMM